MTVEEMLAALYRGTLTKAQAIGEAKATIIELDIELTQTGYYHGVGDDLRERYNEILGFVPLPGGLDNPHEMISTKPETEEARAIGERMNEIAQLAAEVQRMKWLIEKLETERFSNFFPTPMSPSSMTELQIRQSLLRGEITPRKALGEACATLAEIDWKFVHELGEDSILVDNWYENMTRMSNNPDLEDPAIYDQTMNVMHECLYKNDKFDKQAMKIGWDPRDIQGLKVLERQLTELVNTSVHLPDTTKESSFEQSLERPSRPAPDKEDIADGLANPTNAVMDALIAADTELPTFELQPDIEPQFSYALEEGGVIRSAGDGKYCVVKSAGKYFDFMLDHHPEVLLSLPELTVRLLQKDGTSFKNKKVLEQALYRSRERIR